jgi:exodeoxyribonuclease VII large subunit
MTSPIWTVSEAAAVINQTLEYAFPNMVVVGEVANYKISGGKWVFFDIKDDAMSLKCFMAAWNLRVAVEDGMRVQVVARPRLGKYGFSLNVDAVKPVGEGSIKKAFEMLRRKLEAEGLFAPERKRPLPALPSHIGVISSREAAGYRDFVKVIGARFGGLTIEVADTLVQGDNAADQIIRALNYFNEQEHPPEVIAILRGGGSRDDLTAFDAELLARAIAGSRVPTIVGVGHEIDVTLADLAADARASTPSNAAEILVPDRRELAASVEARSERMALNLENYLDNLSRRVSDSAANLARRLDNVVDGAEQRLKYLLSILRQLDPKAVLNRGYALVRDSDGHLLRGKPRAGQKLQIETAKLVIAAAVESARKK